MPRDFSIVTETPDERITGEAASMLYSRYRLAASLAVGRRVLEVACGSGQGLGYVGTVAARVVGGDITLGLLAKAAATYAGRVPLVALDAERLPFADDSFDVVVCPEALYYLPDADRFVAEARRVLAPGGQLLIVTINPEWSDFNRSPFATRYFSAAELRQILAGHFDAVTTLGGFSVAVNTRRDRAVSAIKRMAVRLHLVPRTMRGKRLLKRLFLGRLHSVPREVTDTTGAWDEPRPIAATDSITQFKVLYAIASRD